MRFESPKCVKIRRGLSPDPAGGACSAPSSPVSGYFWEEENEWEREREREGKRGKKREERGKWKGGEGLVRRGGRLLLGAERGWTPLLPNTVDYGLLLHNAMMDAAEYRITLSFW